jgi:hypothetical protein
MTLPDGLRGLNEISKPLTQGPIIQAKLKKSPPPVANPSSGKYYPTREPTGKPSAQPTVQPTVQPSGKPSAQPTAQPSTVPTAMPSFAPGFIVVAVTQVINIKFHVHILNPSHNCIYESYVTFFYNNHL